MRAEGPREISRLAPQALCTKPPSKPLPSLVAERRKEAQGCYGNQLHPQAAQSLERPAFAQPPSLPASVTLLWSFQPHCLRLKRGRLYSQTWLEQSRGADADVRGGGGWWGPPDVWPSPFLASSVNSG